MENHLRKYFFLLVLLLAAVFRCFAQNTEDEGDKSLGDEIVEKISFLSRMLKGNVDNTYNRKLDISFIPSPTYGKEAGFGIGVMGSGLYRLDKNDSVMPPSNIDISTNLSLKGFMSASVKGNNYFKNRTRLTYEFEISSKNLNFWGISFDATDSNTETDYRRQKIGLQTDYVYKLIGDLYVGVAFDFITAKAHKIDSISYFEGQNTGYINTGIGASVQYDTRDFIPNPKKGVNILLRQVAFPSFFGNAGKTSWRTTININYYRPVWKGGILAFDIFSELNSNNPVWTLREDVGDIKRMRGYYEGRYMDNNMLSMQAEVRQHVYKRIGANVWGGTGMVFPGIKDISFSHLLPTFGFGLRWEFKHNVNLRVDYGFGKRSNGLIINIAEAF